jgi:Flp pilus assembly protein TadG
VTGTAHSTRGQATVEFVMVLPLVAMVCLAVVQVAVVARRDVLVAHAAREAARAAAVESDSTAAVTAAREAAVRSGGLDASRLKVIVSRDVDDVHVTVRYEDPTDVAMVGRLVRSVTLQERVTMRREDR